MAKKDGEITYVISADDGNLETDLDKAEEKVCLLYTSPQNFIDQMMGRCSVEGSKVWMNCNPENPHNYINEEFIRKAKEKRVYHLHFMMEDNLTLSQKKIEEYKRKWPHSSVFRCV